MHYALLNLTSLSFVLVYTADHALVFLLGWEIAALAAWLLVIWDYTNQKVRFAGFNYLVSTHIGLIFLVAAFMILYTHSASWDLGSFGRWLQANPGLGAQPRVPAAARPASGSSRRSSRSTPGCRARTPRRRPMSRR